MNLFYKNCQIITGYKYCNILTKMLNNYKSNNYINAWFDPGRADNYTL